MHGSVNLKSILVKAFKHKQVHARVFWVTYYLKTLWHKCVEIRAAVKTL
jgi:hypothetical protein